MAEEPTPAAASQAQHVWKLSALDMANENGFFKPMFAAKLGLLCFWAVWFSIAFLTNFCAGLKALRVLRPQWKFASENYRAVAEATSIYGASQRLAAFLFTGVILWQCAAAVLFAVASVLAWRSGLVERSAANAAFAAGSSLWAAFMIADEVFLQYERESSHAALFIAQLAAWMAIYALPG